MTLASKVFLSILLLALLAFGAYLVRHESRTPQSERELIDLAEKDRCSLYARAAEILKRQLPLIKGESYTTPLEPVRTPAATRG